MIRILVSGVFAKLARVSPSEANSIPKTGSVCSVKFTYNLGMIGIVGVPVKLSAALTAPTSHTSTLLLSLAVAK
jgi:hypothetical protein